MTIEALVKAVPPPVMPLAAFDGPWEPVEAELGLTLPQDYKDLMRLYGFGSFLGFLGIMCRSAKISMCGSCLRRD